MTGPRRFVVAALVVLGGLGVWTRPAGVLAAAPVQTTAKDTLPDRLTDQQFWTLSEEMSEANGYFQSDNLLSNEIWFPWIIPDLVARTKSAGQGVYLGVGPEQNFNYIAVLKPKMVFITDIRRGNLHTQLMYKAIFELSKNRSEFFAMLFTKPKVESLTEKSSAADLVNAYWDLQTITANDGAQYKANLKAIQDHLTKKHTLPLSDEDLRGIEYVYSNFYWWGPAITYSSSSSGRGGGNMASYGDLMMATDDKGILRSYLATEDSFNVIKSLEEKNLLVPVVGDFAGPKALRAVGRYIREHGATVTAFYLSNVEQYLTRNGVWGNFCANVATMPLTPQSTFIRSTQGGGGGSGLMNSLGAMQAEVSACGGGRAPIANVSMSR